MVAIFVVAMIIVFIAIDFVISRKTKTAPIPALAKSRGRLDERFILPKGLFHSKSHTWAEVLYNGTVRVGMDDFVQKLLGKIDSISMVPTNSVLKKGDTLFTIRQGNNHLSVKAPISGKVCHANVELLESAKILSEDPYGNGWISIIEPTDLSADLKKMSVAEEAVAWLRREIGRFRDFLKEESLQKHFQNHASLVGVTLHDGGLPLSGVLQVADSTTWEAFEKKFLTEDE